MPVLYAIIVAGGSGNRFGSDLPKQFHLLAGKAMLLHSIDAHIAFHADIQIILVLPEAHMELWQQIVKEHPQYERVQTITGGAQRFHSVKNGLSLISRHQDALVGVHDAARPLVSPELIARIYASASHEGAVVPTVALKDSIRELNGSVSETKDRSRYCAVQTPQCFRSKIIFEAYKKDYESWMTDDASVVEAIGTPIQLVDGEESNIKVTSPFDFVVAEKFLESRT